MNAKKTILSGFKLSLIALFIGGAATLTLTSGCETTGKSDCCGTGGSCCKDSGDMNKKEGS